MISGVDRHIEDNCIVYHINELSDELKQIIRDSLVRICFGPSNADSKLRVHSYQNTLKEFIKRYNEEGSNDRNKGMIGELLFHVLFDINERFEPTSAFFNLEERSFKKGFDVGFYDTESDSIWIAEIKSGEKRASQNTVSQTVTTLINNAKNDLKSRLQTENNSLWVNAINHAKIAISETSDQKKAVIRLLGMYSDDAEGGKYDSSDKNVILAGVVFNSMDEKIQTENIVKKHKRTIKENIFSSIITVAMQKSTYEEVFSFLESEVENE